MRDMGDYEAPNMRKEIRTLVLRIIDGKKALNSTGMLDNRLFKGENNLRVLRDLTGLWSFKYDVGAVPGGLKQKFTTFNDAVKAAKVYLATRNVEIVEVID